MKKYTFSTTFVAYLILFLFLPNFKVLAQQKIQLEASIGWLRSDLNWSIAGNADGTAPNVFSELRWKDLVGFQPQLSISFNSNRVSYYTKAAISGGISGTAEDTDYAADDRQNATYHERFKSTKGNMFLLESGAAYAMFSTTENPLSILGSAYLLHQKFPLDHPAQQLQSYYTGNWYGIYLGIDKKISFGSHLAVNLAVTAGPSIFNGYGNWALRLDLAQPKSFTHSAYGYSVRSSIQTTFKISNLWTTFIDGSYQLHQTFKGKDIVHFVGGDRSQTQLNGVRRSVFDSHVGLAFNF